MGNRIYASVHHREPVVNGEPGGVEGVDVAVGFRAAEGEAGDEKGVGAAGDMFFQQLRIDHHAELRAGAVAERGQAEHQVIEHETAVEERPVRIRRRLRAEEQHLLCAEESEILPVMRAAFIGVVAANTLVLENPEADLLGAGLPGFGQGVGGILVTGFGRQAGVERGEVVGAQCFQRGALQEE